MHSDSGFMPRHPQEANELLEIVMTIEYTPNPHSLKFIPGCALLSEEYHFSFAQKDVGLSDAPLVEEILQNHAIASVMVTYDFIAINRYEWVRDWEDVKKTVITVLKKYLENDWVLWNEEALKAKYKAQYSFPREEKDSLFLKAVQDMIDDYILPAVMADGGFIVLRGYKEGILFVELQGACVGCPSSQVTLQDGVQTLLQSAFPEIKKVQQI